MSALTILIIRHAEKPKGEFPGPGLTAAGVEDDMSLVIRGWQRSGAWAALFGAGLDPDYPSPVIIYAGDPGQAQAADPEDEPSQRPWETITPLCERLAIGPVTAYGVGQETQLAAEVVALTGIVLICWEHKAIARSLLPALLDGQRPAGVPQPCKWDGKRFDAALRLDRALPNQPWSFQQLSPRLLSGDSDAPVLVAAK